MGSLLLMLVQSMVVVREGTIEPGGAFKPALNLTPSNERATTLRLESVLRSMNVGSVTFPEAFD